MTDNELIAKLERIGSDQAATMQAIIQIAEIEKDIRDSQKELMDWLQVPPSGDLEKAIAAFTATLGVLADRIVAMHEAMPRVMAEAVREGLREHLAGAMPAAVVR
ncbi:MAG TPA: hypothetical protein VKI44_23775 [Acetobacteraceae bacterium]|nr:hypothetical protein [Acetobacteraceae bacterium]